MWTFVEVNIQILWGEAKYRGENWETVARSFKVWHASSRNIREGVGFKYIKSTNIRASSYTMPQVDNNK